MEDVAMWAKKVDRWSVTELASRMMEGESKAFEALC